MCPVSLAMRVDRDETAGRRSWHIVHEWTFPDRTEGSTIPSAMQALRGPSVLCEARHNLAMLLQTDDQDRSHIPAWLPETKARRPAAP